MTNVIVSVRSLADDPNYVKCPRCWHYHSVRINYDGLCDRCCAAILEGWPDHESAPKIRANLEEQRVRFAK